MRRTKSFVTPTLRAYAALTPSGAEEPPRRSAPFDEEPGYHRPAEVWLYGNAKLLGSTLACVPGVFGPSDRDSQELQELEAQAEQLVLDGKVLVCGFHNPAHQRVAVVPLRWGAPRILVMSGGFRHHLGPNLKEEPFRAARLWRFQFEPKTDLAVSKRAPDKPPTYAIHNAVVDRMIQRITAGEWTGLRRFENCVLRVLAQQTSCSPISIGLFTFATFASTGGIPHH